MTAGTDHGAGRGRALRCRWPVGCPAAWRSLEVLRLLKSHVGDRLVLVSVGGVTTADVVERLDAGAPPSCRGTPRSSYEGPFWAAQDQQGPAARGPARHPLIAPTRRRTGPGPPWSGPVFEVGRHSGRSPRRTCGLGRRSPQES
ncbi:hypothetical protein QJS66_03545 [Kocuria rhizophila]|nr:hypothetical protein QJS66_03545 [Kocuria rhizophila]